MSAKVIMQIIVFLCICVAATSDLWLVFVNLWSLGTGRPRLLERDVHLLLNRNIHDLIVIFHLRNLHHLLHLLDHRHLDMLRHWNLHHLLFNLDLRHILSAQDVGKQP